MNRSEEPTYNRERTTRHWICDKPCGIWHIVDNDVILDAGARSEKRSVGGTAFLRHTRRLFARILIKLLFDKQV